MYRYPSTLIISSPRKEPISLFKVNFPVLQIPPKPRALRARRIFCPAAAVENICSKAGTLGCSLWLKPR